MHKGKKIVTSFDYPPIPTRDCDWSAVLDGYDAGDPIGRGPTETAAVADLLQQLEEKEA
jgi:hypothetical protein